MAYRGREEEPEFVRKHGTDADLIDWTDGMADVLELVADERTRQEMLRDEGSLVYTAAQPDCPDSLRLAALVEEVGEVARALHDADLENLAIELVQVAAVAVAWREAL